MASKPHGESPYQQSSDLAEVKLTKYTRLTVGQLKCTYNFSRQITSAGAEISHERVRHALLADFKVRDIHMMSQFVK